MPSQHIFKLISIAHSFFFQFGPFILRCIDGWIFSNFLYFLFTYQMLSFQIGIRALSNVISLEQLFLQHFYLLFFKLEPPSLICTSLIILDIN